MTIGIDFGTSGSAIAYAYHLDVTSDEDLVKLKKEKMREIKSCDDVRWILTVPALWSARAKAAMIEAARSAKMINDAIDSHLSVAYEPDCASIYVSASMSASLRERELDEAKNHPWRKGAKYLLLDLGGGTADIATHQCVSPSCVTEVRPPSGGPWGSVMIDDQFEQWLCRSVMPPSWLRQFKLDCPQQWMMLMHAFGDAKQTFTHKHKEHCFTLGTDFANFVKHKLAALRGAGAEAEADEKWAWLAEQTDLTTIAAHVCETEGKAGLVQFDASTTVLTLHSKLWRAFFDEVIGHIVAHCKMLIEESGPFDFFLAVGGLSRSVYVQRRLLKHIGAKSEHRLRMYPCDTPSLAVVKGAARMGMALNARRGSAGQYVGARRVAKTFGVAVTLLKAEFVKQFGEERADAIPKHLLLSDGDGEELVAGVFYALVKRGQEVGVDEAPKVLRFTASASRVALRLFESDEEEPVFVEEARCIAEKTFSVCVRDGDEDEEKKPVEDDGSFPIAFAFGQTVIQAYIDLPHLPMHSKLIRLNYLID